MANACSTENVVSSDKKCVDPSANSTYAPPGWADRIGLDAVVPVARWRGYGGKANLGDRSFDTFTWAAG